MIDRGGGSIDTPLIDATNDKIRDPNYDCSKLRDPRWALKDTVYRYAPDEPATIDWSGYTAPSGNGGSANDFNGAQENRPAPMSQYEDDKGNKDASDEASDDEKGKASEDCPLDYTGYYPMAGCSKYAYCAGGSVVGEAQPCSPGTLFDVTIITCAYADQVSGC